MIRFNWRIALFATGFTLLAGCGGGDGGIQNGVFLDSPVQGLAYKTATQSGVTNADGVYTFRRGETIEFNIGGLLFPAIPAQHTITPLEVVQTDDIDHPGVSNVLRLLQSLDADSDPSNGIVIPASAQNNVETPVLDIVSDLSTIDSVLTTVVEQTFFDDRPIVDAESATEHFISTLSQDTGSDESLLNSGQRYFAVEAGVEYQSTFVFIGDADYQTNLPGVVENGMLQVNNGVYRLTGNGKKLFLSLKSEAGNQVSACLSQRPLDVDDCADSGRSLRLFAAESDAIAYAESGALEPQVGAANPDPGNLLTPEDLFPFCVGVVEDDDGDGYGWEDGRTCLIDGTPAVTDPAVIDNGPTPEDLFPLCVGEVTDDNGDGYGWEDNMTCLIRENATPPENTVAVPVPVTTPTVTTPVPATPAIAEPVGEESGEKLLTPEDLFPPCVGQVDDDDGDGYGWQSGETCLITENASGQPAASVQEPGPTVEPAPAPTPEPAPVPEPTPTPAPAPEPTPVVQAPDPAPVVDAPAGAVVNTAPGLSDITDLILLTGQSNAAGLETAVDALKDAPDDQVFAFTASGWEVASLEQVWDDAIPGNPAGNPYNNVVFQIGKSLAQKDDRVVGVVLVTAPGEGISHWDFNSEFYLEIRQRANAALSAIPHKSGFDAMVWMQGESDWLFEGTADTGATGFASTDTEFFQNYYPTKLSQLISNLRSESWFGASGRFICAETKKAPLNPHLLALNADADDRTGCAAAADLATRPADPFGNSFSAESLRVLGQRLADVYLSMPQ